MADINDPSLKNLLSALQSIEDIPSILRDTGLHAEHRDRLISERSLEVISAITKELASKCNQQWSEEDAQIVYNFASRGYGALLAKYGLAETTDEIKAIWEFRTFEKNELSPRIEFLNRLMPLLDLKFTEGRRPINDLFDNVKFFDLNYRRMNYLLDSVNMGILPWDEFIIRMKANIEEWSNKISSENYIVSVFRDYKGEREKREARMRGEWVPAEEERYNIPTLTESRIVGKQMGETE